jgi:hypothetical protein
MPRPLTTWCVPSLRYLPSPLLLLVLVLLVLLVLLLLLLLL